MNFVIPSTLYLHSWTMIRGFEELTQSISPIMLIKLKRLPPASSWENMGRFFTQTQILSWSAGICYVKFKILLKTYRLHALNVPHVLLYHHLEIHVYLDALCFVKQLSFSFLLPQIVHLFPSFFSILLESFDLFQARRLLCSAKYSRSHINGIICSIFEARIIDRYSLHLQT